MSLHGAGESVSAASSGSGSEAEYAVSAREVSPQALPTKHSSQVENGIAVQRRQIVQQAVYKAHQQYNKQNYVDAYRELCNSTLSEIIQASVTGSDLLPSQIGASFWSLEEKHALFTRLGIAGRHDLRTIASAVATKSEPEVRDYLDVLQDAVIEDTLTADHIRFGPVDVAAAAEISPECESALDRAADALSWEVEKRDDKQEIARHGDHWLLTEEVVDEIEAAMNPPEKGSDHQAGVSQGESSTGQGAAASAPLTSNDTRVPAANLLSLRQWLELSRLFMNHVPGSDEDWTSLIKHPEQGPSMYQTAFNDFHRLTVSLTKRLVQAVIFQAMSRLRATDRTNPEHVIRHQDVFAAVASLGLKNDWNEFWVGLARRNNLAVWTKVQSSEEQQRLGQGYTMSYDEVEKSLRYGEENMQPASDQAMASVEEDVDSEDLYDNSDFWTESVSDDDEIGDRTANGDADGVQSVGDSIAGPIERKHRQTYNEGLHDRQEDGYLEAFDQRASRAEELRLWDMLGKERPDDIKPEDIDLPAMPTHRRKRLHEMLDWRDKIEYLAEWEVYDRPPSLGAFQATAVMGEHGKRRRTEAYKRMISGQEQILEIADESESSSERRSDDIDNNDGEQSQSDTHVDDESQDEDAAGSPEGSASDADAMDFDTRE